MAHNRDTGSNELGIARIFPQWFKDLDSALKPVVSSLMLLTIVAPVVALTINQWSHASQLRHQINALLASGGSRAELASLTTQFQTANHRAELGIALTAGVAWFGALVIAYSISKLSSVWLKALSRDVRRAADGDLTTVILRDNKSQVGDLQEALGKMIGSFDAIVRRIATAADELREAAGFRLQGDL